jgi:hypothetical protein
MGRRYRHIHQVNSYEPFNVKRFYIQPPLHGYIYCGGHSFIMALRLNCVIARGVARIKYYNATTNRNDKTKTTAERVPVFVLALVPYK